MFPRVHGNSGAAVQVERIPSTRTLVRDMELASIVGTNRSIPAQRGESSMHFRYDHVFKVVMVGESGVGKTSLAQRFTGGVFPNTMPPTIGVDFSVRVVRKGDKRIKMQLWDTSGQETMRGIVPNYFRFAEAIVLVYDSTDIQSFLKLPDWLRLVDDFADPGARKFIMATKCDRIDQRTVTKRMAQDFAKTVKVKLYETSALNGDHVEDAFLHLVTDLEEHVGVAQRDFLVLRGTAPPSQKRKCC